MMRLVFLMLICGFAASGCNRNLYDPSLAAAAYPVALHSSTTMADMQVFRHGESIEIINSTARSHRDFHLWVNQRYVKHVQLLPAGESVTLSLWDFRDDYGDAFYAGGFFRSKPATPVRMVEIQTAPDQPMIGLVVIRAEEVRIKPEPGR